jgi:hypothetical protein
MRSIPIASGMGMNQNSRGIGAVWNTLLKNGT